MTEYHSLKEFLPANNKQEEKQEIAAETKEQFGEMIAAILIGAFNAHKSLDVMDAVYSNINI